MVPPIKSWRVENKLKKKSRLCVVPLIYDKLIVIILVQVLIVYWFFYRTDILSYQQLFYDTVQFLF